MKSRTSRKKKLHKATNIYDVARHARVSVFTVSTVVNKNGQVSPTLRRRVERAIQKLNYRPNLLARGLVKRQTHTIGIVVRDIVNPFFPLLVRGAEDAAQKAGYSVLLCNSDDQREKEEQYLELLLSKRVDGILLNKAPGNLSASLRQLLAESKVPVVSLMRTSADLKGDAVVTDDEKGAFEAVSHLARVGHRRIALVSGPLNVSNGKARWRGFRKALKAAGLQYEQDLVTEGDYHIDSGYRAGLFLLPRRPDAVFVANYLMTVGLMKAADEIGLRCPDDFGLASFDDYPWLSCFRPRLTTVELPKYEIGATAVQTLLERISGKRSRRALIKLMPELHVRESCGFMPRKRDSKDDSLSPQVKPYMASAAPEFQ
ncbi:MAG: LacI family transcriptional regulator [Verrucomicrobia bacterium]|nr:MAG: LacI family transcriptional regulator [Verrucomicrobiota bacterium]PYL79477.1 MAG: LacI family transcriptional regulator [Verrucomicrobiota bacterium]